MLLTAMPGFFVGMLLILLFALKLNILPATGISSWKHFVLPSLAVASVTMATFIRMTRSTMLEVIRQDYVRTARAKGASKPRIVFRHCLRNAAPSYLSLMAASVPHILGGTYVIEAVFSYPGLGTLSYESARYHDYNMLMVLCMLTGAAVILFGRFGKALSERLDPRVRGDGRMGEEALR